MPAKISPKAKPILNWEAHVRRLVESLGEGEVSLDVFDHQVTNIEVEEITCLFSEPAFLVSESNQDARIDAPSIPSQRGKR
jgi:hypothetical protein